MEYEKRESGSWFLVGGIGELMGERFLVFFFILELGWNEGVVFEDIEYTCFRNVNLFL